MTDQEELDKEEPDQDELDRKEREQKQTCERCGHEMYDRHCKVVCPNCGYLRDCSDP